MRGTVVPCLGDQWLAGSIAHCRPGHVRPACQALHQATPVHRQRRAAAPHRRGTRLCAKPQDGQQGPVFLSDVIRFESDADPGAGPSPSSTGDPEDAASRVEATISRATRVLEAARQALKSDIPAVFGAAKSSSSDRAGGRASVPQSGSAAGPGTSDGAAAGGSSRDGSASATSTQEPLTRRWSAMSHEQDLTRHVLQNALDQMAVDSSSGTGVGPASSGASSAQQRGSSSSSSSSSNARLDVWSSAGAADGGSLGAMGGDDEHGAPSWTQSFLSSSTFSPGPSGSDYGLEPQLQLATAPRTKTLNLTFADAELDLPTTLPLTLFQSEQDAAKARTATLPPFQSVMELTSAYKPPERTAAAEGMTAGQAAPTVGRQLADGSGILPDGTRWEKKSGLELGKNGYWKRWHLLRGASDTGDVEWEETWWEASDWTGMKELGALKSGKDANGGAWRETWTERLAYTTDTLDTVIERTAHKWAHDAAGDEWEEKWGEYYTSVGQVAKYADKWGKQGPNVWHERWGEDYDTRNGSDAVVKWTDKWAERLLPGGAREQWGDKWREEFAGGRGAKNGEVWTVDAGGHRYQRWWGEDHYGDGRVRRHGSSTAGEAWDDTGFSETYYNPVPHFGFKLALDHSPQLKAVPMRPHTLGDDGVDKAEKDPFGPGLDSL